jgi:hypothetical protein
MPPQLRREGLEQIAVAGRAQAAGLVVEPQDLWCAATVADREAVRVAGAGVPQLRRRIVRGIVGMTCGNAYPHAHTACI